jgi:hypothetical protein
LELVKLGSKAKFLVLLHTDASDLDVLKSYFYVLAMSDSLQKQKNHYAKLYESKIFSQNSPPPVRITTKIEVLFEEFVQQAQRKGWNCSGLSLGDSGWRVHWNNRHNKV